MTENEIQTLVLEKLTTFLGRPITEADLAQGYDALGADSMDMVALAFELEKATGQTIQPEVFIQFETISEAMDVFVKSAAGA